MGEAEREADMHGRGPLGAKQEKDEDLAYSRKLKAMLWVISALWL